MQQVVKQLYGTDLKYLPNEGDETDSPDQHQSQNQTETEKETASHSRTNGLSSSGEYHGAKPPESRVHSNLTPLLAALETRSAFYLIYPYTRFTLFDITIHSPAMFDDSVAKVLFVIYQLLKLLDHCHSKGVTLGELSLKNIFVDTRLWVQLRLPPSVICEGESHRESVEEEEEESSTPVEARENVAADSKLPASISPELPSPQSIPTAALTDATQSSVPAVTMTTDKLVCNSLSYTPPALHLAEAVEKWRRGYLSNFDYLMVLNYHAGRRLGDPNNHPMFPWVMDFTHSNGGYRDFSQSKHRITKGDRQLDFTYLSAQEEIRLVPDQDALVPHHIGDVSSDITYYVYLARRTPKEVLCAHVRPRWVPEEYPSSIEKMYIWSPDECIPEYFVDPNVFKSIHPDLPDLEVPSWCSSPEELVSVHRTVLEGEIVSSYLHNWIDLVFGYKLSGEAASRAKNVHLSLVDKHKNPSNYGIVQLFRSSHPKRIQTTGAPLALFDWPSHLNMSSIMNINEFSIEQLQDRSTSESAAAEQSDSHDTKTLDMILGSQTVAPSDKVSPKADAEGHLGNHDNTEDEMYGSYEYVNYPGEVTGEKPLGLAKSGLPNNDIRIDYGEVPIALTSSSKPSTVTVSQQKESIVLAASQPSRFRSVPVVNYIFPFRQRKSNMVDLQVEGPEGQSPDMSLPKDSKLLEQLGKLDELAHFVNRSCKDDGGLFKDQWKPEDFPLFKVSHLFYLVPSIITSSLHHVKCCVTFALYFGRYGVYLSPTSPLRRRF